MIVNEPLFIALVIGTVCTFFLVPVRWRHGILILSGICLYLFYAAEFLPLVAGLVLLTYWVSGRLGVWINVAALVGVMFYFKLQGGFGVISAGITPGQTLVDRLVFPLGLSFLTFELIHFSIERQRGKIPQASLASLAAFAFFFPCRIAGPIKRYQPFEKSVRSSRWSVEQLYRGLVRILWGFLKKVMLADLLVLAVPWMGQAHHPLQVWGGLVAYSFYIFLDFSAYSDIAIGISWLMGLNVPENFRAPYLSRNIREFWSRWHISLSSWLGDYLFLPISKRLATSKVHLKPQAAAAAGFLITFAICGLWHGPSANFLLWGLYHGALLSLYSFYRASRFSTVRLDAMLKWWPALHQVLAPGITFLVVTIGWVLFAVQGSAIPEVFQALWTGR